MTDRRKPRLADVAAQVMAERQADQIWCGMFGMLDDIFARARGSGSHPVNNHRAVLDAVRRSPRFEHVGYIRSCYVSAQERRHPVWRLKACPRADPSARAAPADPPAPSSDPRTSD